MGDTREFSKLKKDNADLQHDCNVLANHLGEVLVRLGQIPVGEEVSGQDLIVAALAFCQRWDAGMENIRKEAAAEEAGQGEVTAEDASGRPN